MATPAPSNASLTRQDQALLLSGSLDRDAATTLWPQAAAAANEATTLDVSAVTHLDSAGLALLVELAARIGQHHGQARIVGAPPGFAELRAAYRLDADLQYTTQPTGSAAP